MVFRKRSRHTRGEGENNAARADDIVGDDVLPGRRGGKRAQISGGEGPAGRKG